MGNCWKSEIGKEINKRGKARENHWNKINTTRSAGKEIR